MSTAAEKPFVSEREYLERERCSLDKHEYYQGEVFMMAGASRCHNQLTLKIGGLFADHLQGSPCEPYVSDMRLHIEKAHHYVYPDVLVVCGEEAYHEEDRVTDATVIVEVLSESTERYDRGLKFHHYQTLPSLKEYVLVSQAVMRLEIYRRIDAEKWHYEVMENPKAVFSLSSLGFETSLETIYSGVRLPLNNDFPGNGGRVPEYP